MDTDDMSKRKLHAVYRAPTPEMLCYLDFSVSTTGMLAGIKVTTCPTMHFLQQTLAPKLPLLLDILTQVDHGGCVAVTI